MERQYSAILACCFALWGQGQRSEAPGGSWGRAGQRPTGWVGVPGAEGHQNIVEGGAWVPQGSPIISEVARTGSTHESTWFSKDRMTG
jgi:hypothetical protein